MKSFIVPMTMLVSTFLILSGCKTVTHIPEGSSPAVQVRDPMAPNARIRMNSVAIVDKSLQQWDTKQIEYYPEWLSIFFGGNPENEKYSKIAVEQSNARRSPSGTVEVWATFRNRTDYPLTIECRSHFFDRQEAPVEAPSAWQRVYLPQQSIGTYKEFSTNVMDVGFYYIEVREAR